MTTSQALASPDRICSYIYREYPELAGYEISVGLLGGVYRIVVKDRFHVLHTLNIPVSEIPP
jgi:hypothetical protein